MPASNVDDVVEFIDTYHQWYYDTKVWTTTTWIGVPCQKSVQDLWSYQEVINELEPSLVVEFGVAAGGSTLYYASVLDQLGSGRVLGVDIDLSRVPERVIDHPRIELLECSSTEPQVIERIVSLREAGSVVAILDSDHSRSHVLSELETITPVLRSNDYLVVEDSNINGHPVAPNWGPGPYEAIEEYLKAHPAAYRPDTEREAKFGWTFAPRGFLIRA